MLGIDLDKLPQKVKYSIINNNFLIIEDDYHKAKCIPRHNKNISICMHINYDLFIASIKKSTVVFPCHGEILKDNKYIEIAFLNIGVSEYLKNKNISNFEKYYNGLSYCFDMPEKETNELIKAFFCDIYISNTTGNKKEKIIKCSKCNDTGIIDTIIYKRRCMCSIGLNLAQVFPYEY